MAQKTEYENLIPVFTLKPLFFSTSSHATVKYIGNIDQNQNIMDDILEIETDKETRERYGENMIFLGNYNEYTITAQFFKCNIPGGYLIQHRKIPVYYMTIQYSRKFCTGYIFTVLLYFTFDDQTIRELSEPKKYINRTISGTYSIELRADEGFFDEFIQIMKPNIENQLFEKYCDQFDESELSELSELNVMLMEKISEEVENQIVEYRNMFEPIMITNSLNKKNIIDMMKNVCHHKLFPDLIRVGLFLREKERHDTKCPDQEFSPPKNVINLRDVQKNPEKFRNFHDNELDNSSDSE